MTATASAKTPARPRKAAAKRPPIQVPHPPPPREETLGTGPPAEGQQPATLTGAPWEPVRLTPAGEPEAERRVPVFSIVRDGEETVYTVLGNPRYRVSMEYVHRVRTEGVGMALDWLLGEMLGEDGYAALRSWDELTEEDTGRVIAVCTGLALGRLELPKDSPSD
jgi:hypothetical protein